MNRNGSVVVVGAGLGGLGTAVRLARAGYRVTLLEKNERVGGKLNLVEAGGFRFDTGPSLITMPGVLAATFRAAGRRMQDYVTMARLDPICRYTFADGTRLDVSPNIPRLVSELDRIMPGESAGFLRFLAYARTLYRRAGPTFLLRERPTMRDLLSRRGLDAARIDAHLAMHTAVRRFFRDPRLVQLFDRYATYNGSSPYRAPATLAMIPYIELAGGGWYIQGGLYRLAESLLTVARELGVEVRTNSEVEQVLVVQNAGRSSASAVGVRLSDGDDVRAGTVIINADPMYAYPALIPQPYQDRRLVSRMRALEPSCSGFVLLLGVKGDYSNLAHHSVFFSGDYQAEFRAIFDEGMPASDPTIYVACTSKTDPTQAPSGYSNLFVLVNAPALPLGQSAGRWQEWAKPYRDSIIAKLEKEALPGLSSRIVYEQSITPQDFKERYNVWRGAIYGLSSNSRRTAFLRPPNRAPGLDNLYFVGGSVHPGGGIPLVLLSARLVTRMITGAKQ
ncbi:MAG TPA: phytoene desaturase family protein [Chloroflexia bacterium]|nr:phytoene desaturase family protein [Chloroflexia bacterium]